MKLVVLGSVLFLLTTGCLAALERRHEQLQVAASACTQTLPTGVVITERQDSLHQVTWTAQGGPRTCRCVQPTISATPASCTLVSGGTS